MSVQWYRGDDDAQEEIANIQNYTDSGYTFIQYNQTVSSLRRNCTQGILYADTFGLVIDNFTMDKNGYYWCQILINDSFLNINPSQRAWFYAEESNSCVQGILYYNTSRAQCALGKQVRNSNNKYYFDFNNYHSDHQMMKSQSQHQ